MKKILILFFTILLQMSFARSATPEKNIRTAENYKDKKIKVDKQKQHQYIEAENYLSKKE